MKMNISIIGKHLVLAAALCGAGLAMSDQAAWGQLEAYEKARDAAVGSAQNELKKGEAKAVEVLLNASRSKNAFYRANAMEAVVSSTDRAIPMLQLGLEDENAVVRFASLMSIGKLREQSLGKRAAEFVNDSDASVRAAAIFAAQMCGQKVDMTPLAGMLMSRDLELRGNVVMIMGLMGNKSAIPMLADMSRAKFSASESLRDLEQVQFAEAMVRLGREEALDTIRVRVYRPAPDDGIRVLAISTLGKLHDANMMPAFKTILKDKNVNVRVAAATSMAEMGSNAGVEVLLEASKYSVEDVRQSVEAYLADHGKRADSDAYRALLENEPAMVQLAGQVRGQAAFGLGELDDLAAARRLVKMLDDELEQPRLSAAAALLKSLSGQRVK